MSDDRLIELESRVAFQEEGIHSLNQILQQQQKVIDKLQLSVEELRQRLMAVSASPLDVDVEEPPPPHY